MEQRIQRTKGFSSPFEKIHLQKKSVERDDVEDPFADLPSRKKDRPLDVEEAPVTGEAHVEDFDVDAESTGKTQEVIRQLYQEAVDDIKQKSPKKKKRWFW
ncbi:MAG: hypothetical protein V1754_00190 [Pseudomonadota bacterium]